MYERWTLFNRVHSLALLDMQLRDSSPSACGCCARWHSVRKTCKSTKPYYQQLKI